MDIEDERILDDEEYKTPERTRKSPHSSISLADKCKMYLSDKDGQSHRAIAMEMGRSFCAVNDLINKANTKGTLDAQHHLKGRYAKGSSVLSDDHRTFILKWLIAGEHKSSNEVWQHLISIKRLKRVGYDAVNEYLKSLGSWVKPQLKTMISEKNLRKRLEYCTSNKDVIIDQDVLFTDESQFELNRTTARVFKFSKEAHPEIEKLSTWVRQMVWAGISWRGKTRIYFIDGWINNQRYVDILKAARTDILGLFDGDFFFQQDNARPHIHKNSMRYIRRWISSNVKEHPPQSPDLNPIEIVWGKLKNMVEARRPRNKEELKEAILECWDLIPMDYIRNCIRGLKVKMEKAIEHATDNLPEEDSEDEDDSVKADESSSESVNEAYASENSDITDDGESF